MVESNTTDFFLNYMYYGNEDTKEDRQYWCITAGYKMVIIAGVFIVVCLCGLVGNMVVVRFLGFHMKKNPFTVYVLNLAIADFSLLLFFLAILTLSLHLHYSMLYYIYSPEYDLSYYILMVLFLFFYYASMYLLTAMSMERCFSVLFPIWYRCHRPKHLSGIVCGVLWALDGLFVFFTTLSCNNQLNINCDDLLKSLSVLNFLIFCLLPLLSNLFLFIRLRCGSQRRQPGKLYVAVLLSVVFMFIFGFPPTVIIFTDLIYKNVYCLHISYLLAPLNSSVNPVIYFLVGSCRKHRFQDSVKVALQRVFEEKVTSEDQSHVPGDAVVETTV